MIKKEFSIILMTLVLALSSAGNRANAYDITMKKPVFEDYIPILEQAGYLAYSFDIHSLNDSKYRIRFSCREYERDSLVNKDVMVYPIQFSNMSMVKDFSEEDQISFKPEELYDSERGIHRCAEKIVLGTFHKNDSTTMIVIDVDNMGASSMQLNLRPLIDPQTGKELYVYQPRPFEVGEIEFNTFIPLVYYGSAWLDKDWGFFRFCGEAILNPGMTDRLIKDVPYSYVIGITVTKIEQ